jgi:hypothetical protein
LLASARSESYAARREAIQRKILDSNLALLSQQPLLTTFRWAHGMVAIPTPIGEIRSAA